MKILLLSCLCWGGVILGSSAFAAPEFSHQGWDTLLQKHVVAGEVDYKNFDRVALDGYLKELSTVSLKALKSDELLALWINAYNAYTVALILDNYPLKSIKDISKPWDKKFCKVGGTTYSLNDIEHKILRKEFKEPRIHFAIVCASIGCPPLASRAYEGGVIDAQLERQAKGFFTNPQNTKIESSFFGGKKLSTSKILSWFGGDFGKTEKERVAFIRRYVTADIAKEIDADPAIDLTFLTYDWKLNGK